jgi:ATP-dependent Clp protease ATP-binding subunit ClpB
MNRIDRVIVFRTLQPHHLREILEIELGRVQERVTSSATEKQFVFECTDAARDFLLREGTDTQFGARHLKRAIERHLVFPLSNLLATGQIALGDLLIVDSDPETNRLCFLKQEQGALVAAGAEAEGSRALVPVGRGPSTASTALVQRAVRN